MFFRKPFLTSQQIVWKSCITVITDIVENSRQHVDQNHVTILTFFDHRNSFDSWITFFVQKKRRNIYNILSAAYLIKRLQTVFAVNNIIQFQTYEYFKWNPRGISVWPFYVRHPCKWSSVLSECDVHLSADDVQIYVSSPVKEKDICDSQDISKITKTFNSNVR